MESPKKYILDIVLYTAGVFTIGLICWGATLIIPEKGIVSIVYKGMIAVLLSNVLFVLIFRRSRYFEPAKELMLRVSKLNKLRAVVRKYKR